MCIRWCGWSDSTKDERAFVTEANFERRPKRDIWDWVTCIECNQNNMCSKDKGNFVSWTSGTRVNDTFRLTRPSTHTWVGYNNLLAPQDLWFRGYGGYVRHNNIAVIIQRQYKSPFTFKQDKGILISIPQIVLFDYILRNLKFPWNVSNSRTPSPATVPQKWMLGVGVGGCCYTTHHEYMMDEQVINSPYPQSN